MITPQPKGVKRSTLKRRKKAVKNANIAAVRELVEKRDKEDCRIKRLLARFGFSHRVLWGRLELAHIKARGMGGNPDLSRDTPENTLLVLAELHNGGHFSMHGGYLEVSPMTERGADGPLAITFYEALPTEVK